MKTKRMKEIILETLEQLEDNAGRCLEKRNSEGVEMYLNFATGVRMVLDGIEAEM